MEPGWQKSVTRVVPLKDVLALLQVLASMKAAPALIPVQSLLVFGVSPCEGQLPPMSAALELFYSGGPSLLR